MWEEEGCVIPRGTHSRDQRSVVSSDHQTLHATHPHCRRGHQALSTYIYMLWALATQSFRLGPSPAWPIDRSPLPLPLFTLLPSTHEHQHPWSWHTHSCATCFLPVFLNTCLPSHPSLSSHSSPVCFFSHLSFTCPLVCPPHFFSLAHLSSVLSLHDPTLHPHLNLPDPSAQSPLLPISPSSTCLTLTGFFYPMVHLQPGSHESSHPTA